MSINNNLIKICLLDIIKESAEILSNDANGFNDNATDEQARKVKEFKEFLTSLKDELNGIPF